MPESIAELPVESSGRPPYHSLNLLNTTCFMQEDAMDLNQGTPRDAVLVTSQNLPSPTAVCLYIIYLTF